MESAKSLKPHFMMIPYPLQGHVTPFVNLAIKLAAHGFTITFVNTDSIHHHISTAYHGDAGEIFSAARSSGQLDIRYTTVNDGFPLEFDRSLNRDQFHEGIIHVFSATIDDLIMKLSCRDDPPVTCLIADMFYVCSSMICDKHNLVNVSFWTQPALVLNLYYHTDLLISNGHFKSLDNCDDVIDYIPGVKAIEPKDLMSRLQVRDKEVDTDSVVYRILFKVFEDVKRADFVLCNTVQELEPDSLSALQAKQPVYAIGPVYSTGSTILTSLWAESDCTEWLKGRPTGSVLYVSFGSYAHVGLRNNVEKVKCHFKDAVTAVGSSETNFNSFVVQGRIQSKLCNINCPKISQPD